MSTAVENSAPVVALIRLLGWATSAPSRRQEAARLASLAAQQRCLDRAQRALTAPQNGSYVTQTPAAARCSHLGCAGAVVAAPHGWTLCSDHRVMMVAR